VARLLSTGVELKERNSGWKVGGACAQGPIERRWGGGKAGCFPVHLMSLENSKSGRPSHSTDGEGCHAASSNRQLGAVDSGGVSGARRQSEEPR